MRLSRVPRLIHMCRDSFTCATTHSHVPWLIHMRLFKQVTSRMNESCLFWRVMSYVHESCRICPIFAGLLLPHHQIMVLQCVALCCSTWCHARICICVCIWTCKHTHAHAHTHTPRHPDAHIANPTGTGTGTPHQSHSHRHTTPQPQPHPQPQPQPQPCTHTCLVEEARTRQKNHGSKSWACPPLKSDKMIWMSGS